MTRHVTRYGRKDTKFEFAAKPGTIPTDLELGTRRARAAALLMLSLPGAVYIYQGEELGLPEVEDLPTGALQDPMFFRPAAGIPAGTAAGCRSLGRRRAALRLQPRRRKRRAVAAAAVVLGAS